MFYFYSASIIHFFAEISMLFHATKKFFLKTLKNIHK